MDRKHDRLPGNIKDRWTYSAKLDSSAGLPGAIAMTQYDGLLKDNNSEVMR